MINGFIFTAITELGKAEIIRNSKIPIKARLLFKKKILSNNPYSIKFLFLNKKVISLISLKGETREDLRKGLVSEMKCEENKDYTLRLI